MMRIRLCLLFTFYRPIFCMVTVCLSLCTERGIFYQRKKLETKQYSQEIPGMVIGITYEKSYLPTIQENVGRFGVLKINFLLICLCFFSRKNNFVKKSLEEKI